MLSYIVELMQRDCPTTVRLSWYRRFWFNLGSARAKANYGHQPDFDRCFTPQTPKIASLSFFDGTRTLRKKQGLFGLSFVVYHSHGRSDCGFGGTDNFHTGTVHCEFLSLMPITLVSLWVGVRGVIYYWARKWLKSQVPFQYAIKLMVPCMQYPGTFPRKGSLTLIWIHTFLMICIWLPFHGIRKDLKHSRKACNLQCLPAEKRELRAIKWGEIGIHPPCIGESFKVASVESWHMVAVSGSKVSQMNGFFANQGMGSKYTVMSYEKYVRLDAEFFDVVKQTFHRLGVANFWVKVMNFCQPYFLTIKAFLMSKASKSPTIFTLFHSSAHIRSAQLRNSCDFLFLVPSTMVRNLSIWVSLSPKVPVIARMRRCL